MTLAVHRGLELALGALLFALAIGFSAGEVGDFSAAGLVVCLLLAFAVILVAAGGDRGDRLVSSRSHAGIDRLIAVAAVLAAIALWLGGQGLAALLCVLVGAVELGLVVTTHYVAPAGPGDELG